MNYKFETIMTWITYVKTESGKLKRKMTAWKILNVFVQDSKIYSSMS